MRCGRHGSATLIDEWAAACRIMAALSHDKQTINTAGDCLQDSLPASMCAIVWLL